jgi:hypothetical protein
MSPKANRLRAYLPNQAVQRLKSTVVFRLLMTPGILTVIYAYRATSHSAPRHPGNAHWR